MIASYYFLALALKHIPLGVAYAIWTGIGVIGTVIFGILLFNEPATAMRFICILMILAGIICLKLLSFCFSIEQLYSFFDRLKSLQWEKFCV